MRFNCKWGEMWEWASCFVARMKCWGKCWDFTFWLLKMEREELSRLSVAVWEASAVNVSENTYIEWTYTYTVECGGKPLASCKLWPRLCRRNLYWLHNGSSYAEIEIEREVKRRAMRDFLKPAEALSLLEHFLWLNVCPSLHSFLQD